MCSMHVLCTLYTVLNTLYSIYCTLCRMPVLCTLYTVFGTLYIEYTIHCAACMYCEDCILYSARCIACTVLCSIHVLCRLYTVLCTLCTRRRVHFTTTHIQQYTGDLRKHDIKLIKCRLLLHAEKDEILFTKT
jgi:hypothetical protein